MTLDEILSGYRDALIAESAPVALPIAPPEGQAPGYVPDRPSTGPLGLLTSWQGIGDALRANNNLFTAAHDWLLISSRLAGTQPDPNFNVFRDYDMKGLEQYAYQFRFAQSKEQADIIRDTVVQNAASRQKFSELDWVSQLAIGMPAQIGPVDMLPVLSWPKGILAATAFLGGATGVQSALRQSMSPGGEEYGSVLMDMAFGGLFAGGLRTFQRIAGHHAGPAAEFSAKADAADQNPTEPPTVSPQRTPEAEPTRPFVMPDSGEPIVAPRPAASDPPPFVIEEAGPAAVPMSDHRRQPIHDPEAALGRPVILYEPVYLTETKVTTFDGGPMIIEGDVYKRPWVVAETNAAGEGTARSVPSTGEIVTGRVGENGFWEKPVLIHEDPAPPPTAAQVAEAEAAAKASRPVIIEDRSVGAAQAQPQLWTPESSELASAGGLERFGFTPAIRLMNSMMEEVRIAAGALVNHGMVQMGNLVGLASEQSVEARYMALHANRIDSTVRGFWEDYRNFVGLPSLTGSRTVDTAAARLLNAGRGTSYKEFMRQVSIAIVEGGHQNAAVVAAAKRFYEATEELRVRANEVGYWDFLYGLREKELQERIGAAHKAGNGSQAARLAAELQDVQAERAKTAQRGGPVAQDDEGYLPRYYRHDKIMADRANVERIFDQVIQAKGIRDPLTGRPFTGKQAVDILLNIDEATGQPRPYVKPKGDAFAHSARDRGFSWMPTKLLTDYIEMDAEVLFRRYVRQMGMDIEITARFGDPFMHSEIQGLAARGARPQELEDLMFLRDYLRGTHAPLDPTSILTHSVQAAKYVANAVVLGSQVITAFTDLARPAMTEGFKRAFGTSIDIFNEGLTGIKLWRKEAELLGATGEMVQSLRAQAFANGNSAMAGTPGWLQAMERAHAGFFIANGIAPWTEIMKSWQSAISVVRIMEHVEALAKGQPLSAKAMTKLATIGIDARNAGDLWQQIEKHQVHLGRTRLPNIAHWDNLEAAAIFRTAAWQAVNNSIITPGAANVSRWMVEGTSWLPPQAAQLISMYHNYGLAVHQRLLVAGLQGADADFLSGAVALIALGWAVDNIRENLNTVGDRKARQKTFEEKLLSAVDRSGLLGYLGNVNNAVERLSMNTVGIRPFTGQVNWGSGSIVGAMGGLGPVGSWAGNLYRVVNGAAHGREGWAEAQAFRRMFLLQNVFWLDGLFDKIQDAYYVSPDERRERERQRRTAERAAANRQRDEALAGRILVEQGYIDHPEEVLDIETYIGDLALKWHRGGRKGPLSDFLMNGGD